MTQISVTDSIECTKRIDCEILWLGYRSTQDENYSKQTECVRIDSIASNLFAQ